MRINYIEIEGLGPIRNFKTDFADLNYVIGINGCGKTTMLNLIATLAGTKPLHRDALIGHVYAEFSDQEKKLCFEAKDTLRVEDVEAFKSSCFNRMSYGSFFDPSFLHGDADHERIEKLTQQYRERTKFDPLVRYRTDQDIKMRMGDGSRNMLSLIYMLSLKNGGIMLDLPEVSLDCTASRILSRFIRERVGQTIVATHSPEILAFEEKIIEM